MALMPSWQPWRYALPRRTPAASRLLKQKADRSTRAACGGLRTSFLRTCPCGVGHALHACVRIDGTRGKDRSRRPTSAYEQRHREVHHAPTPYQSPHRSGRSRRARRGGPVHPPGAGATHAPTARPRLAAPRCRRAASSSCAAPTCSPWTPRSASSQRRRARARRRDHRGRREPRGAGRRGDRRARHDLHARLHRHPLAPVDQLPAPDRARRQPGPRLLPGHQQARPPLHARRTAIARSASASPRRSAPASPRCTTGRTTCAAPPTPMPRSPPCATPACAAASATAPRRASPTISPWTSRTLRASNATSSGDCHDLARHCVAQRRPRSQSDARQHHHGDGEEGVGRGARARRRHHAAHFRPEPGEPAQRIRPARPGPAAGASAAHHRGGARPAEGAQHQLLDRAGRRGAPSCQRRRDPARRAIEAGVRCSMSTDHSTTINCDCFVGMRILYALHQHRIGNRIRVNTRRLVELATIDGARDLGIADRTGSLTPGKRADLILVRTTDINMTPAGDPFESLVGLAQPSNVDTVVVDGRILRRGGRFAALDHAKVAGDAMKSAADLRARGVAVGRISGAQRRAIRHLRGMAGSSFHALAGQADTVPRLTQIRTASPGSRPASAGAPARSARSRRSGRRGRRRSASPGGSGAASRCPTPRARAHARRARARAAPRRDTDRAAG